MRRPKGQNYSSLASGIGIAAGAAVVLMSLLFALVDFAMTAQISSQFKTGTDETGDVSSQFFWFLTQNGLKVMLVSITLLVLLRRRATRYNTQAKAHDSSDLKPGQITTVDQADSKHRQKLRAEMSERLAQLGEMASGIAHEINNPLAIISGYNHFIRKEITHPNARMDKVLAAIDSTEKTILRITKIISGLRTYARDGSKDPMLITSIQQVIEDTISMTESNLKFNGVDFRTPQDIAPELAVFCRHVQMVQVLVALISNSLDAVKGQNARWIELGVNTIGQNIQLTVTDSGHGISPEIEKRIFEPFFTTKEVGHGTGLGLSISYGIIQDHHGTIFVDHLCPNTRFVIQLPMAATHSRNDAA
jgi:C4-dicarboxylate-specific signal transduction histidine kinase